jgi:hypothetical protein
LVYVLLLRLFLAHSRLLRPRFSFWCFCPPLLAGFFIFGQPFSARPRRLFLAFPPLYVEPVDASSLLMDSPLSITCLCCFLFASLAFPVFKYLFCVFLLAPALSSRSAYSKSTPECLRVVVFFLHLFGHCADFAQMPPRYSLCGTVKLKQLLSHGCTPSPALVLVVQSCCVCCCFCVLLASCSLLPLSPSASLSFTPWYHVDLRPHPYDVLFLTRLVFNPALPLQTYDSFVRLPLCCGSVPCF